MRFIEPCKKRGSYEFEPFEYYQTLISSNGIKYSELTKYKDDLDSKYGVYHIFSKSASKVTSLYIGKAGKGKGNKEWSLYQRLKQHRQSSQPDTVHGAIAAELGCKNSEIIELLNNGEVYIQTVHIDDEVELENKIKDLEDYCKSLLSPKYTKQ